MCCIYICAILWCSGAQSGSADCNNGMFDCVDKFFSTWWQSTENIWMGLALLGLPLATPLYHLNCTLPLCITRTTLA